MEFNRFGALCVITFVLTLHAYVTNARVKLLEAHHSEVVIENVFLGRKLGESHQTCREEHRKRDLSLQMAVAGFRTGHWWAYDQFVQEARRNRVAEEGGFYVLLSTDLD